MIFVTVGNATQGFLRLLEAVDRLAHDGFFGEEPVFVQSGYTEKFRPLACTNSDFLSMDAFEKKMREASLIICHGGCGTLLHAGRFGKTPVTMPRRKKYGEHVNDHQVQLIEAFSNEGILIPAWEPTDLPGAIKEARRRGVRQPTRGESLMVSLVARAIDELMEGLPNDG